MLGMEVFATRISILDTRGGKGLPINFCCDRSAGNAQNSQRMLALIASPKKSQLFLIGRYLLENAEFTYVIVECFPVKLRRQK